MQTTLWRFNGYRKPTISEAFDTTNELGHRNGCKRIAFYLGFLGGFTKNYEEIAGKQRFGLL